MPSHRDAKGVLIGIGPAAHNRADGSVGLMLDAITEIDVEVAAHFVADVYAAEPGVVVIGRPTEGPEAGVHCITAVD